MAVKIPVYERHVQLDAAAQTMPRYTANDQVGKALTQAGNAMMLVGAHWKAKQEQFENFQMMQRESQARATIQQIIQDEIQNYDPGRDRPGTLHDRIMQRVTPLLGQLSAGAPDRLKPWYDERNQTLTTQTSEGAAKIESQIGVQYYTRELDKVAGQLAASLKTNPDTYNAALTEMRRTLDGVVNLSPSQKQIMLRGYTRNLGEAARDGYISQGRYDDAREFVKQFSNDQQQYEQDHGGAPVQPAPSPQTNGPRSDLNQNRIDRIDANPTVKDAIEKAAAATGMDPNTLKVYASIESGGKSDATTGSYHGLFQLSKVEFGMNGGGDINNPYDNAMAGARLLQQKSQQMTQALGRPPTASELYLSHQQGVGGATAHLNNPDQPAWQSMLSTREGQQKGEAWAKQAIWGNVPSDLRARYGNVDNISSRDFAAIWDSKVRGVSVDSALQQAQNLEAQQQKPTVVADASGHIIGGMQSGKAVSDMQAGQPTSENMSGAINALNLSPQERALYDRHITNLYGGGGVTNADGSRSTIRNITFEENGKTYVVPTVRDGKILSNEDAIDAARKEGLDKFPSYNSQSEADARYNAMHDFMEKDTARYFAQRNAGAPAPPNGPPATQTPPPFSQWGSWGETQMSIIDGAQMKASSIRSAMTAKLKNVLQSDIMSTQQSGQGVSLPRDLADYFKTDKLTHEFVSNKLGEGAALSWEEDKQTAQRVYGATANMAQMPASVIAERLADVAPVAGSPDYVRQQKVYLAAEKTAGEILKDRYSDPAAAADQMPDVQAALAKVHANPSDMDAAKALVEARMKAQQYLEIPESAKTPITLDEARNIAIPLLDRANPNPSLSAQTVVKSVMAITGNNPDLAHRALSTVLQVKGVTNDQAQMTAAALETANRPPPTPLAPDKVKTPWADWATMQYSNKDSYLATEADLKGPSDNYADPPDAGFVPGSRLLPADHIKQLLGNRSLAPEFDATYGAGAADWVFKNTPNADAFVPTESDNYADNPDASTYSFDNGGDTSGSEDIPGGP